MAKMRREARSEEKSSDDVLHSVSVKLPSRGVPYGDAMPDGEYKLKPPRIAETKYIAQLPDHPELFDEVVTTVLGLITLSPKIDPELLTAGDRSYLFLWIRAQIDPFYRLVVVCPKCMHPNKNYPFQIRDVPLKELPKEYVEPFNFTLERSKVQVTLASERQKTVRERDKYKESVPNEDRWLVDCVAPILAIDGKPAGSLADRVEWIQTLQPGDDILLSKLRQWYDHGPDYNNCPLVCQKCKERSTFILPFRRELYFPTVSFERDFGNAIDRVDVREGRDSAGVPRVGADGGAGVPVGSRQSDSTE